jgi:hypothetical protein
MTTFRDATKAATDLLAAIEANPRADHCDAIMHVADLGVDAHFAFAENCKAGIDCEANSAAYESAQIKLTNLIRKIAGI